MTDMHAHQTEHWQACAPGTLGGFAARARGRRRLRGIGQAAGAVVLLAAVGLTVWSVSRPGGQRDNRFGGIACSDVHANIEAYKKGLLPPDLTERIRVHLAECPACQEAMKAMKKMEMGERSPGVAHGGSWWLMVAHGGSSRLGALCVPPMPRAKPVRRGQARPVHTAPRPLAWSPSPAESRGGSCPLTARPQRVWPAGPECDPGYGPQAGRSCLLV